MTATPDYEALFERCLRRVKRLSEQPLPPEEVDEICSSLLRGDSLQRRLLVQNSRRAGRIQVVQALLRSSRTQWQTDADQALALADAALDCARALLKRAGVSWTITADLVTQARAYRAHGLRLRGLMVEAEAEWQQLRASLAERPALDLLVVAEALGLYGSFLYETGTVEEALLRLDRSAQLFEMLGERNQAARARLAEAEALRDANNPEEAIARARVALRLLDPQEDPKLAIGALFSLGNHLFHSGRPWSAFPILDRVETTAELLLPALFQLRVRCLKGRVHAALEDWESALWYLEEVRKGFLEADLPFDAACASLDLALCYAARGMPLAQEKLAREMLPIFTAQGVPREAMAAFLLYADAAQKRQATRTLVEEALRRLAPVREGRRRPAEPVS